MRVRLLYPAPAVTNRGPGTSVPVLRTFGAPREPRLTKTLRRRTAARVREDPCVRDTFRRSGDVGRNLLAVDWAATPLGPPESWPNSLQAAVRIVLSSRFSMWMAWGPELTFFCNDAYRRDTLGAEVPLGARASPPRRSGRRSGTTSGPASTASWRPARSRPGTSRCSCSSSAAATSRRPTTRSPTARSPTTTAPSPGMLCVVKEDTEEVIAQPPDGDAARPRARGRRRTYRRRDGRLRLRASSRTARSTCRSRWSTCTTTTAAPPGSPASTGFPDHHPAAPDVDRRRPGGRPGRSTSRPRRGRARSTLATASAACRPAAWNEPPRACRRRAPDRSRARQRRTASWWPG